MMNWNRPLLGLCLLLGGCAPSADRLWSDPPHRSVTAYDDEEHASRVSSGFAAQPSLPLPGLELLDELGVDDAIRVAIANSPRLRRAGYQVDSATGRVTQAGLYPNPAFAFGAEGLGSDAGGGGETTYLVEQEIPLGGKLRRARGVAEADRWSAQAEFVAEEFAVASRVTRAYFGVVAADERATRRQDLVELADQLLGAATARVDAGAATEVDRLRAEIATEQARLALDAAVLQRDAARRALALAMGVEGPVTLPLISEPDVLPDLPHRDELVAAVLATNSRAAMAQIALERARRAHHLAKAEAIPDLVASIGPRYSDPEGETTLDFGIGIDIPLFDRNQGGVQAAIADRMAAAAQLHSVQLELRSEVSAAWSAYEASRLAAARYREQLLPKTDRTLDLTRQAYERGKADYLRLLDAQQVVVECRIAYVDAQQKLQEAAALLRELAQIDAPWRSPRDGGAEEMSP